MGGIEAFTTDYTFGLDEIAQRAVDRNSSGTITADESRIFGHGSHGSVRVLYDHTGTAASIAQAMTFAAYGDMIALHDSLAVSLSPTLRVSSLGYSGEHFDASSQQQCQRTPVPVGDARLTCSGGGKKGLAGFRREPMEFKGSRHFAPKGEMERFLCTGVRVEGLSPVGTVPSSGGEQKETRRTKRNDSKTKSSIQATCLALPRCHFIQL
jgi:hypothetical protein